MTERFVPGTWMPPQELRMDVSSRGTIVEGGAQTTLPYPEARYWSDRTGQKVFKLTAEEIALMSAAGEVIVDAAGNVIVL